MNSPVSSISSRFSAAVCRQAFRSSRNLAAASVPPFGTLRNLKDDSGLTFGTLRNPEDDRGLTFGNFRMYAEERGLTFGADGTPGDRRRLKGKKFGQGFKNRLYSHPTGYPHSTYKDLRTFEESQTSKRQRLLNVSFKKRTRKRRNVLVSSFVGRLKVCTHTPNFKMSQTFECFFKKRSYKRRNVLVSSFVGRLKVCTHTPNFKMSKTFECFLKNKPRPTGYPYSTHKGSRMYKVNRQS